MNTKLLDTILTKCVGVTTSIPTNQLEEFTRLIVIECVQAVERTDRHGAYTTYDWQLIESTIKKCTNTLKERWQL